MLKVSFNVHAQNVKDKNKLLNWLRENKPTTVLVLNDRPFATECANLGIKNVILRLTNNDDDIQNKINTFQEWWDAVKATYREDKRLIVHFDNEPHNSFEKYSVLAIEGMEILHREQHRGVFGNFGVGWPNSQDWNISLRPFMQKLVIYPDDEFYLGLHEYYMVSARTSVPFAIARYRELFQYYDKNTFKIILTEFGSDDLGNPHLRGHKDYPDGQVLSDYKFVFNNYYNQDECIEGVCAFCYGNSGGWDKYDFEGSDLVEQFKELAMGEITRIQPLNGAVNRRTGPSTSFPTNGQLRELTVVTKLGSQDGWSQYQFTDGVFWLSDAVIKVVGATIAINLYNAPEEDVERANAILKELLALLVKYKADAT